MAFRRGYPSLLAVAVLTTGLLGCSGLGTTGVGNDDLSKTPGGQIENPGDQLLSNSAASAIGDVVASLRDIGAVKHMASQQPLLSNSSGNLLSNAAGSLLSNGMSGYRITGLSSEAYAKIVWKDSLADDWPGLGTFEGQITGTLDGVVTEQYSYTVKMTETTYERRETVEKSDFREKGDYVVTGASAIDGFDVDAFGLITTQGKSVFKAAGGDRVLDYKMVIFAEHTGDGFQPWDVVTTVQGALPNGAWTDTSLDYQLNPVAGGLRHTLKSAGLFMIDGRTIRFRSSADLEGGSIAGFMQLNLSESFRLHFDFASNTPLKGSVRNAKDENLGALTLSADKKAFVVKHPDQKTENLELAGLPRLYVLGLETALPPF